MAKKKKPNEEKTAVDRLVEASQGDDSGVDKGEADKAKKEKGRFFALIPAWIKALFIKWWFAGAVCFFFFWGLGGYISDPWATILVIGLASGVVTDLLTNNFMRLFETAELEYHPWMLFGKKKFWTLFANVGVGMLITLAVVYLYQGINVALLSLFPDRFAPDSVPLGVEPLLFATFYLAVELIPIGIKNLILHLIHSRKKEN